MNVKIKNTLMLSAVLISMTSCATIIEGKKQNIKVSLMPERNVSCNLENGVGSVKLDNAPGIVEVPRSKTDLNISCYDAGGDVSGNALVESSAEPWTFGNLFWGLLSPIGFLVDAATGAMFEYPSEAVVRSK